MTPVVCGPEHPGHMHLCVTTKTIPRKSIYDLPLALEVRCTHRSGWQLLDQGTVVAGEYEAEGLRLDVAGYVILDTLGP